MGKVICGEKLIASAMAVASKIADCLTPEELITFCEFLGLLKHDIEIIRMRRFLAEKEKSADCHKPAPF